MEEITIKLPIEVFLKGHHQYKDGYLLEDKLIAEEVYKEFLSHQHLLKENSLSFHIVKVPYTLYEKDEVMFRYSGITEELLSDLSPYNLKILFTEKPIVRIENPPSPMFMPLPERLTWWQKLKNKLKNRRLNERRK